MDDEDSDVEECEKIEKVLDEVIHRIRALDFVIECMIERASTSNEET